MLARLEPIWVFTLSSSSCGKVGFKTASATISSKVSVCLDKERAENPVAEALNDAPRNSISSAISAFVRDSVPLDIMALATSIMPALSPSWNGWNSRVMLQYTDGVLWFSTTINVMPLASLTSVLVPMFNSGAGPGSGALLRSIWAEAVKPRAHNIKTWTRPAKEIRVGMQFMAQLSW